MNQFTVFGYQSHFSEGENLQLFVACDKEYFCCRVVALHSPTQVVAEVHIPDTLPAAGCQLYANTLSDGTIYLPNAFVASGVAVVPGYTHSSACKPSVQSDKQAAFGFPFQPTIFETIRNLMWHVPMWFAMFALMIWSFVRSLQQLAQRDAGHLERDRQAMTAVRVGLVFCVLGLLTGSMWARFTWGNWWVKDPQLNGAAVVFLIYCAYLVLRHSVSDEEKRARLSAIYNIFAFVMLIMLLFVFPRLQDVESLHPGKSGTPAFSSYDLDSSLRMVFYPAVLGWILLAFWLYNLRLRIIKLEEKTA